MRVCLCVAIEGQIANREHHSNNNINFVHCRMDLLFWKNIVDKNDDLDSIRQNVTYDRFETVYNGNSLFHYYAKNVDVIEIIH